MGISKSAFAKHEGVSKGRVSQWLKSGVITCLPDGSIDPERGEYELSRNRDASKRFDYESRIEQNRFTHDDGPPPPFTGNIFRDALIMGFPCFYKHIGDTMGPILIKLLTEFCHVPKEEAEETTICLIFTCHEIIQDFLKKDIFNKWLQEKCEESLDGLQGIFLGGRVRKSGPPKNLPIMTHSEFIIKLLKDKHRKD
jgi:hypothetical protein